MTVGELIEKLKTFDPNLTVFAPDGYECEPCEPQPEYQEYKGSYKKYSGVHL